MIFHFLTRRDKAIGFHAILTHQLIQTVGNGLLGIFVPIFFLMKFSGRIDHVLLVFLAGFSLYALSVPVGAIFLNRLGIRRSLRFSLVFECAMYAALFFYDASPALMLGLFLFSQLLMRVLFWVPFHVDLAKFTVKCERGRKISTISALQMLIEVVMPIVSGYILATYGFGVAFILAIIVYAISSFPFALLPETYEKFTWSLADTYRKFFAAENRKLVLANFAYGMENGVGGIIWPIFIWQILRGNFLQVGAISSAIVFITMLFQLTVGRYADVLNKRTMLHFGTFLYALGWLAKIFVLTAFQVFIVGIYHNFTSILKDTPFTVLNYDLLADCGHYIDEYTVLKEMAIQLGKVAMLLLALVLVSTLGLNWTFAIAAIASLLINIL